MNRMPLDEASRLAIKSAFRQAVAILGGQKIVAAEAGLSDTQISRFSQPHMPDLPSLVTVLQIDRALGEPLILNAARDCVLLHAVQPLDAQDAGTLALQSGAAVQGLCAAIADGRVSPLEARVLQTQIAALLRTVNAAKKKIDHLAAISFPVR